MRYEEISAALDLVAMLFSDARIVVLAALLVAAAVIDCRVRRIPNALVLAGILFGIVYNVAFPPNLKTSVFFAPAGLLVGFFMFLPLYLMRATGAGDVKLFAMVGAFLGPFATFCAGLATFMVGGLIAIAYVLRQRTAMRMANNLALSIRVGVMGALAGAPEMPRFSAESSAGRFPYALAIAIGTMGYVVLRQLGIA